MLIGFFIVLITSLWVYNDANKLGVKKGVLNGGVCDMNPGGWFWACLGMWIISFPVYVVMRSKYKQINGNATERKCPFCAENVKSEAILCRFCNRELLPLATVAAPVKQENSHASALWAVIPLVIGIGIIYFLLQPQQKAADQMLLSGFGPDNPIAVRINSLNSENAYAGGMADGCNDTMKASIEMHWSRYDYREKLADVRELKAKTFDLLESQNKFNPIVFQRYKEGWDAGASTLRVM